MGRGARNDSGIDVIVHGQGRMKRENTIVIDVSRAILNHLAWKIRLHDILRGTEVIDSAEKISQMDCELGQWLHSELLPRHESVREVRELDKTHGEIHDIYKKVLELRYGGDIADAESELMRLEHLSQKMFSLLLDIRSKLQNRTLA